MGESAVAFVWCSFCLSQARRARHSVDPNYFTAVGHCTEKHICWLTVTPGRDFATSESWFYFGAGHVTPAPHAHRALTASLLLVRRLACCKKSTRCTRRVRGCAAPRAIHPPPGPTTTSHTLWGGTGTGPVTPERVPSHDPTRLCRGMGPGRRLHTHFATSEVDANEASHSAVQNHSGPRSLSHTDQGVPQLN